MLESNRVYHGDCLDVMKKIDDKSIDMILADLPYAVTQNEKDKIIPFKPLWEEYERIIKDNGAILLFAQGLFYIDLVISNRKLFKYDLVWDKKLPTGFLNANKMPLRIHEQIAVFYKKLPTYNPQFSEGPQSHSKGSNHLLKDPTNQNYGKYKSLDANLTNKKYPTSIISKQKPHPSVALHRTEKSVECLEWLIKTYTNPGELVLDNCAGSGTTGLACQNSDRKFILIEKDLSYIPVIKKRLFGEPVERT